MARKVRVATMAQRYNGGPTIADNREKICDLIEQAAAEQPDIICLPETFVQQGVAFETLDEVAETVPGPTTSLVASYAKKHHCYIMCPLITIRDDKYMNEAVLIDRRGQIMGAYAKIHPVVEGSTFTSLEKGVTPGDKASVFETDFGRIGMQICFDMCYPDGWAALKRKGAEIVFWPSAYNGGQHLSIQAWNHHYYVVSAVQAHYARVVGIMGEVLAKTGPRDPIVAHTIDLDIGLFHCDFNNVQIPKIRARYGPAVTITLWHEEGLFTLVSNQEALSVADVVHEFKLDPLDDYLARNARLQDAWRAGETSPDLTPDYVGRVQWV